MNKRALLLGVENYPIPDSVITSASNDLRELKYKLSQLGFEIFLYNDCHREKLDSSIETFLHDAPCDSINVVYFTGHGFQYMGKNYILPIDFRNKISTTNSIKNSAYNLNKVFEKKCRDIKLIVLVDACRNNIDKSYRGHYSESLTPPINALIAYATQFDTVASYTPYGMSHFTSALCNNILSPNISINTLFEKVRNELNRKGYPQISHCISGFTEEIKLNSKIKLDNIDIDIYEYIEKYGDEYGEKYGVILGEYEVYIDASRYFDIPLLDIYYKYSKVQAERYNTDLLSESENKLITFFNIKSSNLFEMDEYHTWYYKNQKIRMGEIPMLPSSMERIMPIEGNGLDVSLQVEERANVIVIHTNLPDGFILHIKTDNMKYSFKSSKVSNGKCIFFDTKIIKDCIISSPIVNVMTEVNKEVVGAEGRNLIGQNVKFNPIGGITIYKAIRK